MSHLVLARKHRPTRLDGLIGQDAIVRTLTNALQSGRIAQAYLFTGVRGTGKTSTARILARALNCAEGPTPAPCGTCPSCRAIAEDRHMDVLEIDAATHTKVEETREFLDGIGYAPTMGRYKVYIVDEVHMLSKHSFNAMLKTLEEPPPHAVFMLATTEVRKIPATILSRCQRFDLRRVDVPTLAGHFAAICAREGVTADPAALHTIARSADGSVRDGLSILDQAIATGDGRVDEEAVRGMLGLGDRDRSRAVSQAVLSGDAMRAIATFRGLVDAGADTMALLDDLLETAHLAAIFAAAPDLPADGILAPDERAGHAEAGSRLGPVKAQAVWQALSRAHQDVAAGAVARQAVELAIVRAAAQAAAGRG